MEAKRLKEYVKLCRKLGVTKLAIGDVVIEIDLAFEPPRKGSKPAAPSIPAEPQTEDMTPEDLLYWSSGPAMDQA